MLRLKYLRRVVDKNVLDSQFYLVGNGQSQIYVKSGCIRFNANPLTLFDKGFSYLTRYLHEVYLFQRSFLLSFVVSICEFVTFPLVSWVGCGT